MRPGTSPVTVGPDVVALIPLSQTKVILMEHSANNQKTGTDKEKNNQSQKAEHNTPEIKPDHLYNMLKPLHHLPRGKNTWDPKFIKIWWFWPASAAILMVLYYLYPILWGVLFGS